MRLPPGNDLNLGQLYGTNKSLTLHRTERSKHLYFCGGTGTGKTKLLENLIRQDIKNWHKSKCGLMLLDPHGALYDSLIEWLAWNENILDVPVIPIDLRQDDWIVSYNLLRRRETTDPAVLVDNITDAMAYVWGQDGTNQTPLFARWVGNVIRTLYENQHTLIESEYLIDRVEKQVRHAMASGLSDKLSQSDWGFADMLSPKEFENQIGSTVNRLMRFIRNQTMRSIFGQPSASLDLGKALEEGSIILVCLATEGGKISPENAKLFGTLLLSDLWTAAQQRGKRDDVKPFYLYTDEFQKFVTPTIAENLDQARGFGLHLTLTHQFPMQLKDEGRAGLKVYHSVMENASSKIVFRLTDPENLEPLAKWLFMGVMNPDEIKHQLYSTKVMSYREEMREIISEGNSSSFGRGTQRGHASGAGLGGTAGFFDHEETLQTSESWSQFASESGSENQSWSEGTTRSRSLVPTLVPVFGKELAHVQFRSLEEQIFRSMALLFSQNDRHGIARIVNMFAPVSIFTPTIHKPPASKERTRKFLDNCYAKLPFALPNAAARKQIEDRKKNFSNDFLNQVADAPVTAKRRIR